MRNTIRFLCCREEMIHPIPACIAVVIHDEKVLLVRRANAPDAGRWGFPGGKVEFGETIEACAIRELYEETSVLGDAVRVFTAVDAFDFADDGLLRQHFILIAVLCRFDNGVPSPGDDALEARWFTLDQLNTVQMALSLDVQEVANLAASQIKIFGEA